MNKDALKTWSEYMNMNASNGESVDAHVYYKLVIKETH